MADRDFNIPLGPDTTQSNPVVTPEMATGAGGAPYLADDGVPLDLPPVDAEQDDIARFLSGESEAEAESQMEGMQMSFAALRDSMSQGRELKARERDREELEERLVADREELADRENILANYRQLVYEQDAIISQNTQQRDMHKNELAQITAELEEASEALDRMREYHDGQLEPLETTLGRARANAERAKNDERSRKGELSAAEKEASKAEGGDVTVAAAKVKVFEEAYDEAVARSNSAKEYLDQAQKAYDDLRQQVEQAEAPLERSIDDMNAKIDELKASIDRLGETISVARKRRQYCDSVYQYPDETAKLRSAVEADEQLARQMDAETDELRDQLAESKQKAKTAKIAIGAIIAVIVIIIVVIVYVVSHG